MNPIIEITRLWILDGCPHREIAQLCEVAEGGHEFDLERIEGTTNAPMPPGRYVVVTVTDPAVEPGSLSVNPSALYDLPLIEGARLVDQAAWAAAAADREQERADAETEVSAELRRQTRSAFETLVAEVAAAAREAAS